MGGIIIGYEIGKILDKETIFSERVNGEFKLRRDFRIKRSSKVLIVEDVITTGSLVQNVQSLLRKQRQS